MYKLACGEVFSVKRDYIKVSYLYEKKSAVELFEILVIDLKKTPEELGFDICHLPDRDWL